MDDALRNPADERHETPVDAGGDPPTSQRDPVARFCSWCNEIAIRGQQRANDIIVLYVHGAERRAFWNGKVLLVQDGICERCRREKFPETVKP
jgi:hypothetical protein